MFYDSDRYKNWRSAEKNNKYVICDCYFIRKLNKEKDKFIYIIKHSKNKKDFKIYKYSINYFSDNFGLKEETKLKDVEFYLKKYEK